MIDSSEFIMRCGVLHDIESVYSRPDNFEINLLTRIVVVVHAYICAFASDLNFEIRLRYKATIAEVLGYILG